MSIATIAFCEQADRKFCADVDYHFNQIIYQDTTVQQIQSGLDLLKGREPQNKQGYFEITLYDI